MTTVIEALSLGKFYRISHQPKQNYLTLRDALSTGVSAIVRSREKTETELFWALKNLDVKIEQGERVAVIGRNGAGKSTFLKLLSRITQPSEGRFMLRGRVSSLLEVGTGFHQELTGRENIFLNGAILNMRAAEIRRKFDQIVEFSEIEEFLDTPVKRYSSGMFMRLAFAVAAHLEPEILLVDEVLAVGDVEFRNRCLGKMGEIAAGGRTIVFVSHNMGAVRQLCNRALWLDGGRLVASGEVNQVVDQYHTAMFSSHACRQFPVDNSKIAQIRAVRLLDSTEQECSQFVVGEHPMVEVEFQLQRDLRGVHVAVIVYSEDGTHLFSTADSDLKPSRLERRKAGQYTARVELPFDHFNTGHYLIVAGIGRPGSEPCDRKEAVRFAVHDCGSFGTLKEGGGRSGTLLVEADWHYLKGVR